MTKPKPKRITITSPKYNRAVSANARRRGKVWGWFKGGRVQVVAASTKEKAARIAGVERTYCDETFDPAAVETARAAPGRVFEMCATGVFERVTEQ